MIADMLLFFSGHPEALECYTVLAKKLLALFPEMQIKVQKTQISFVQKHLFACVSLPRKKSQKGIIVTIGLARREESARVQYAVEPYPGRWTHHIGVSKADEIDEELLSWTKEAWTFAQAK